MLRSKQLLAQKKQKHVEKQKFLCNEIEKKINK